MENYGKFDAISPDTKRLLGIRDFEHLAPEQKDELLKTPDREAAFDGINTTTTPRKPKREMKKGIVAEIIKQRLLPDEILRDYPMVYIGSETDIEYPLALGGRKIMMVDPILENQQAVQEILKKITSIIKEQTKQNPDGKVNFNFDFGDGKEPVVVELVARPYLKDEKEKSFSIPENTGTILLFASQGPSGAVRIDDAMKSKIVHGGAILEEADILKIDKENNKEEFIELGQK